MLSDTLMVQCDMLTKLYGMTAGSVIQHLQHLCGIHRVTAENSGGCPYCKIRLNLETVWSTSMLYKTLMLKTVVPTVTVEYSSGQPQCNTKFDLVDCVVFTEIQQKTVVINLSVT